MSGTRTIHLRIDIVGALKNWKASSWRRCCTKTETGEYMTPAEVRDFFYAQLAQGRLFYPFGEPCEGWSWTEGCPGHTEAPITSEGAGPPRGRPDGVEADPSASSRPGEERTT